MFQGPQSRALVHLIWLQKRATVEVKTKHAPMIRVQASTSFLIEACQEWFLACPANMRAFLRESLIHASPLINARRTSLRCPRLSPVRAGPSEDLHCRIDDWSRQMNGHLSRKKKES